MKTELLEKNLFTDELISDAMHYEKYYRLIKDLLQEGKTTSNNQSNSYFKYAKLNFQRMKRVYRTTNILEELENTIQKISIQQHWIVLTEGWCGDAAQILPALARLSELSDKIELRMLLRDENTDIMDAYLTKGSRSIPKLIAVNADMNEELFSWGPRPKGFQALVMEHKNKPVESDDDFNNRLHKLYTDDKTISLQLEMNSLLQKH